ncbi:MAG: 3-methyl-2-oxobutanoate dehydrogenase subunit VorB [Spirochaetes bacterium]|nr:3-methyl-2-oxobutanoate dehydrogenase subunit VorB [Spirochaetota bacterium]
MNKKILMKGNEALAEAAIRAGCRYYFGYPITPQNEVPAYMSKRLPEVNGVFVQAESELASINMIFGAGACGARCMTSSSSPGISLMQEGISYISGAETPAVIVNMMRGGPGLGNIAPSQGDYFQAVKGGGHGDYKIIVFAPASAQEIVNFTVLAFDLTIKYRIPVMILGDGLLGQMTEPVVLPEMKEIQDDINWSICRGQDQVIIRSLYLVPENQLELHNLHLQKKYRSIEKDLNKYYEQYNANDCDYLIFAYGTTARVCKAAIDRLQKENIKIGLFRPISLWPFPKEEIISISSKIKKAFVFEMAQAQFEEDIRLSFEGKKEIKGFYKLGGAIFNDDEIYELIKKNI